MPNFARRQLYAVLKQTVDDGKLDWNTVLREALRRITSEHFLENFRTGRIAIRDAVQIYDCLRNSYPQIASEFESAFHSPPAWEAFILRHRMLGSLELEHPNGFQNFLSIPIPDAAAHSRSVVVMDHSAAVDFHLNQRLQWVESVIALYAVGRRWFPMLLEPVEIREDGGRRMRVSTSPESLIASVKFGQQIIQGGTFSDSDHQPGLIRFLMIVSERSLLIELSGNWVPGNQIPGSELSTSPERLATSGASWALHQINTALLPHPEK